MMKAFSEIYFDIVDYCNAKCPYCHSGANRLQQHSGRWIRPDIFKAVLAKLSDKRLIGTDTIIRLYNWGEPFLHPAINTLVDCLNGSGLKYALSTNGSIMPVIDKDFVRNLDHIIFSMPGFSRQSYARINGLKFQDVLNNIHNITKGCRKSGLKGYFVIFYHVYKFNVDELKKCEYFADANGIIFRPYYAFLNHWWILQKFLQNKLPVIEHSRIENDLFGIENIKNKIRQSPKNYRCPQSDFLIIDAGGNIGVCCQLASDNKDYLCGNILEQEAAEILRNRQNRQICKECIASGLAYYINNSFLRPDFYKRSITQNFLLLKRRLKKCFNRR